MAIINGTNAKDLITGTSENDTITSKGGDDIINAGAGHDSVNGGAGHDIINGDLGNDLLMGEAGNDTIHGGAGNDTIQGGADADTLYGDDGDDTIDGGKGDDVIYGNTGNDTIYGGGGLDQLYGGDGNDSIFGGDNADKIFGEQGDDSIDGGAANDIISGGMGNDAIKGNSGNDNLDGGEGIDTALYSKTSSNYQYVFNADNSITVTGAEGTDKLTNFEFLKFADKTIAVDLNPNTNNVSVSGSEDAVFIPIVLSGTDNTSVTSFSLSNLPTNGTLYTAPAASSTVVSVGVDYAATNNSLTLYFTPNANFYGDVSFNYAAKDTAGAVDPTPATASISITPVNDAPMTFADNHSMTEDDAFAMGNVLDNDFDIDSVLTVSQYDSIGKHGTLQMSDFGEYIYTPAGTGFDFLKAGQTLTENFAYTVSDGELSSTSNITITITGINDKPVAVADFATINEDAQGIVRLGNVLTNDLDPDSSLVAIRNTAFPGYGTLITTESGEFFYQITQRPDYLPEGEFVTDVVSYTISDGEYTSTNTITVKIVGENDAPAVVADADSLTQNDDFVAGNVLVNDSDVDSSTQLRVADPAIYIGQYGNLSLNADGSYQFNIKDTAKELGAGETFEEIFNYGVTDGIATVGSQLIITVEGLNDQPEAFADSLTISEDSGRVIGNFLTNDTDIDGDALQVIDTSKVTFGSLAVSVQSGQYSFTLNKDAFNYLKPGESATETITYTISDGDLTDTNTLTITVLGENDAPQVMADSESLTQNDGSVSGRVLTNDWDVDSSTLIVADPAFYIGQYGFLDLRADGSYTYNLNESAKSLPGGEVFGEVFNYSVSDGIDSTPSQLIINIQGLNDAPVAVEDLRTMTEDEFQISGSVTTNDFDIDNGDNFGLSLPPVSGPVEGTYGTFNLQRGDFYTYTLNGSYDYLKEGEPLTDSFSYRISDGEAFTTGTVTITILGVNDAPTDITLSNNIVMENQLGAEIGSLTALDVDDTLHSFMVDDQRFEVVDGILKLKADQYLNYEDATDILLTITAQDENNGTYSKMLSIGVLDSLGAIASSSLAVNFNTASTLELQENLYAASDANNIITLPTAERAAELGYDSTQTFLAGGGDDYISGSGNTGVDYQIEGGEGNDYIVAGGGHNTLTDSSGNDTVSYEYNTTGIALNLATGTATTGVGTDSISGFENAIGSLAGDLIAGDENDNHIQGLTGDDTLTGEAGNDLLEGGLGNDSLAGGSGDDVLKGGKGEDILFGDEGKDKMYFDEGKKTIDGGEGSDTLTAEEALAGVTFDLGASIFSFNAVGSASGTGTGTGSGSGSATETTMVSNIEDLIGSNFNDILRGDESDNFLNGLSGNDIFSGGDGNDTVAGGDGIDTAVYSNSIEEYSYTNSEGVLTIFGPNGSDMLTGVETLNFAGTASIDVATLTETLEQANFA